MKTKNETALAIEVSYGDDGSDYLDVKCSGSPNQVLGFIARMRNTIGKIESDVLTGINRPKEGA